MHYDVIRTTCAGAQKRQSVYYLKASKCCQLSISKGLLMLLLNGFLVPAASSVSPRAHCSVKIAIPTAGTASILARLSLSLSLSFPLFPSFFFLSFFFSLSLYIYISFSFSLSPYIHLFLSLSLSIYPSLSLYIYLFLAISIFLSLSLSLSISLYLSSDDA